MNPCDQINAMLATQRQLQQQLSAELLVQEIELAAATVALRKANERHVKATGDVNVTRDQLRMLNQTIEDLARMHTQLMCN